MKIVSTTIIVTILTCVNCISAVSEQSDVIYVSLYDKDLIKTDLNFASSNAFSGENTFCFEVEPNQTVNHIQFLMNTNLITNSTNTEVTYHNLKKVENLNFTLLSWEENVNASDINEVRKHYLVKISPHLLFYFFESDSDIKSVQIKGLTANKGLTIKTHEQDSLILYRDTTRLLAFLPVFPSIAQIQQGDNIEINFVKDMAYIPHMFAFLIILGGKTLPHLAIYPSDLGTEYGARITLTDYQSMYPSFEIFLVPKAIVTSFMKKRYEIWGKAFFVEREQRLYKSINFLETRAFTYKDKENQWGIAFNDPINGYLQLDGKVFSIFKSLLYGETLNKETKIKGICQINNKEFFDFEVPSCIESSIPFPETISLDSGLTMYKKNK